MTTATKQTHRPCKFPGAELSALEQEIRETLIAARAILNAADFDPQAAASLFEKLWKCADRAEAAELSFSERQLDAIADQLQRRIELALDHN
jgi:hypothetical protein